jgi:effector-binding domain-containing protein
MDEYTHIQKNFRIKMYIFKLYTQYNNYNSKPIKFIINKYKKQESVIFKQCFICTRIHKCIMHFEEVSENKSTNLSRLSQILTQIRNKHIEKCNYICVYHISICILTQ